nr:copia protein [Tanacetum cinerariifolium]
TFSSVRRLKHSGIIWKKKGSSNIFNVDLSFVSHSKLNKDVKRYSRKDLLSCNNSHIGEKSNAYDCNAAMTDSCNSRFYDSFDENNLFIFDDVNVINSQVSKMSFRKKPSNSLNIVQICLWIIDSRCSKQMTGNRALLTNFVEKFFGTVRFGNNDFAVIVGYGDVVIGSMTIKKVYYVEGLGHNLFSIGQFCDKGLEVTFRKSTCFVQNEDGVDLLTGDHSSNLYTIALNEVASNSLACLLAKASSLQSWLWHQYHLCFACEQGKIHQKHHKSKTAFASNKALYVLHMDLCGSMRVESINGKQYVLVIVDDYSREFKNKTLSKFFDEVGIAHQFSTLKEKRDIGVFVGYSKESASFKIYNKQTRKIHESVNVNFDEISEMASKQFSLEPDLSDLNETRKYSNPSVTQVLEEVEVPSSNIQSVSNNIVPNVDEASTSHNVFNGCLEDAYFDASTSFHDPCNVHTFYPPYPHEKKWTKDHPLHKIIGDLKSSVRTRGQLANSCLFSCLISLIEPPNVDEALKDVIGSVQCKMSLINLKD